MPAVYTLTNILRSTVILPSGTTIAWRESKSVSLEIGSTEYQLVQSLINSGQLIIAASSDDVTSIARDGQNRIISFQSNNQFYNVVYNQFSTVVTGGGKVQTINLDASGFPVSITNSL